MRLRTAVLRKLRRDDDQEPNEATEESGPPLWLRLAQDEIAMRTRVGTGGRRDSLDHMLQMEARLKSQYPHMPFNVKIEFSARLNGRGYTEDAWSVAVGWLEATDWFRVRGRHFNQS